MKRFIAGAMLAGLAVGPAAANPGGHNSPGGHSMSGGHFSSSGFGHGSSGYHQTYGRSFSGGYYYPGYNHSHWSYSGYSSRYRCTCYWCPYTSSYYYWCQSANCYYPVSYYNSAPPGPVSASVASAVQSNVQQVSVPVQVSVPSGVGPTGVVPQGPIGPPSTGPVVPSTPVSTAVQATKQTQAQGGPPAGIPPLP